MKHLTNARRGKTSSFAFEALLNNKASQDVYRELFTSVSTPGILYGLPKAHKPN